MVQSRPSELPDQMSAKFRVLLVYPCRDIDSRVRTQFSQERIHALLLWPFHARTYGLAFNGLETLASLTPDWVDLTLANENLETIDFDGAYDLVAITGGLVPELQRRGAFREAYQASTVRGLLGLARPANRYATA